MWKSGMRENLSDLLKFALQLAHAAEEQVLAHFRYAEPLVKSDGSEVTLADRMAEKVMRNLISTRFPGHGILGEEYGESFSQEGRWTWVLDPIDGTSWFTIGAPLFGTLIGLLDHGEPILGVIHLPVMQETIYAAHGLGCWFKASNAPAVQVKVAPALPLADSVVLFSGIHNSNMIPYAHPDAFNLTRVLQGSRKAKFYGDCVQHTLVCRGLVHAAIDTVMNPWDVAALVPCIREAGGVITSLRGEPTNIVYQPTILSSCGPELHQEILTALQPDEKRLALAV